MNSSSSLTNFSSFKVLFVCGSPRRFTFLPCEKARKFFGEKQKKDEFFSFFSFLFFFFLSLAFFSLSSGQNKNFTHKSFSSVLRRRGKKKTNNTKKTKTKTN